MKTIFSSGSPSGWYSWMGLLMAVLVVTSCERTDDLHAFTTETIGPRQPKHFPEPVYRFENNPVSKAGIELGRRLFYDPILSRDSSISCGTCHAQVHAFADHNVALSTGIEGRMGKRNTPGLANLIWYPAFHWDGGVNHIEIQPFAPITEPTEMDADFGEVLGRLQRHSQYPQLFKAAFGVDTIVSREFFYAVTQFMSTIVSDQSAFDKHIRGEKALNERQLNGLALFNAHCSTCHAGVLQSDFSYRNNGLTPNTQDEGRYLITQDPKDKGAFRVPSLRNVAMTGPYLHDGSIRTLEGVVEAYSNGITSSLLLDPAIPENGFQFTESEKAALVSFLHALTDFEMLGDHSLSEFPF